MILDYYVIILTLFAHIKVPLKAVMSLRDSERSPITLETEYSNEKSCSMVRGQLGICG